MMIFAGNPDKLRIIWGLTENYGSINELVMIGLREI